jgi:hypothetical protein
LNVAYNTKTLNPNDTLGPGEYSQGV